MRLKSKLVFCVTGLLALIFGIGGSLIISLSFNSSLENEKNTAIQSFEMIRNTLTIANSISRQTDFADIVDVLNQLTKDGKSAFAALYLYDTQNKIVFKCGNIAFNNTIYENTAKDRYAYVKLVKIEEKSYFKIYEPINVNEEKLCLMALYDTTEIYLLRENQSFIYRRVLIIMTLIAAVSAWVIAALLTRSLKILSKASNEIATGNLSSRAKIHSGDEIELLANDFNVMASKLENTIDELTDTLQKQEQFMGSFAHEIKTPMTSIIGYADLIRSQSLGTEEIEEAAQYIFTEGKRLESLSFKLLDLIMINKQSFELKKVEPYLIINEAAELLKTKYSSTDVNLTCVCDEGYAMLEADLFESLVINLLDNAYKSLEEKGNIDINLKLNGKNLILTVSDDGRGIPQEELDKITQAFYRVDKSRSRSQGGVGLGLALCNKIVMLHNGSMKFESESGKGTTVTVILRGESDE